MSKVDLSTYKNKLGAIHQIKRLIWGLVWYTLARWLPRSVGNKWKLFLLRLFGATIHKTAVVYSSVRIYAPWNLIMHAYSCLAPEVDCYNVNTVVIGEHSTISQKTYLCTASHDVTKGSNPLITRPIVIGSQAWIGAEVFIGMGVTIGEGAVVGARAAVFKNVEPWNIVGGNPAKFIKKRTISE
jgi:putative colanic acid biosynthesis acetyltransferase WcaF